ncbi:hypothetical protein ATKI12_4689 [Kitasatospora sp. Ki12]
MSGVGRAERRAEAGPGASGYRASGRAPSWQDVPMSEPDTDWITVAAYENLPGCPTPWAAVRA